MCGDKDKKNHLWMKEILKGPILAVNTALHVLKYGLLLLYSKTSFGTQTTADDAGFAT